jgi:hypothetical protein
MTANPKKTENLIETLVSDVTPVRAQRALHFWLIMSLAVAMAVFFIIVETGARSDFVASLQTAVLLWKTLAPLMLGVSLSFLVLQSSRPGVPIRRYHWIIIGGLLALFWLPGVVGYVGSAGQGIWSLDPRACLMYVTFAALLPFGVYLLWLRKAAPTHPLRAGALAGCAAGAFGAFAFANHCPRVELDYIAMFYSLPALGLACLGAVTAKWLCRW